MLGLSPLQGTDRRPIEGESDNAQGLTLLHIVLHCIEVHLMNCICGLGVLNIGNQIWTNSIKLFIT